MGRFREAHLVLEEGLHVDPLNDSLKTRLEKATQGLLKDLLEGTFSLCSVASCPPYQTVMRTSQLCICRSAITMVIKVQETMPKEKRLPQFQKEFVQVELP
jgi:hypothetical protein